MHVEHLARQTRGLPRLATAEGAQAEGEATRVLTTMSVKGNNYKPEGGARRNHYEAGQHSILTATGTRRRLQEAWFTEATCYHTPSVPRSYPFSAG